MSENQGRREKFAELLGGWAMDSGLTTEPDRAGAMLQELGKMEQEGIAFLRTSVAVGGSLTAMTPEAMFALGEFGYWAHMHALDMITGERMYQRERWGDDWHDLDAWVRMLVTQLAHVITAVNRHRDADSYLWHASIADDAAVQQMAHAEMGASLTETMRQMVHIAAVATACIEMLLRNGAIPPEERELQHERDAASTDRGLGSTADGGDGGTGGKGNDDS